ncbi:Putative niacin/nicotinamide transporter NaiP [Methylobacterium crusticola]|uniref:Niacin/nicotinamide transporter NaiP n=1 Tax=Methylobacterium crusticola TaxID=1697972 RepID=A0ABQ4R5F7_9HYPH|nr:MFS transporter [Methylobacterium crusticola]GJD52950.1 Putative niacin/nicotinamide transporter NaiP [Methylobacterium crusticola]
MSATAPELIARLDRLPSSRFHVTVLVVAALSLFFDTLDTVITGFAFAAFRDEWKLGASALGINAAIGLAGYLVGSLLVGFAADRWGRKAVMTWSLALYSLFSASRALAPGIEVFALLNFLTWLFVGVESCVVPPYLAELWPSRLRGRFNGWMMSFFALGIALSPVWALIFLPTVGWRWTLALTAPFALLIGIMRRVLPESPRWLLSQGRGAEAEAVVADIERRVARTVGGPLPPVAPVAAPLPTHRVQRREIVAPGVLPLTLMLWLVWFTEYGVLYTFQSVLPTLLALDGFSIVRSTQFSVVIFSGFIPGYVLAGYLLDLVGRKYWLMTCFAGIAVSGTLFGFAGTGTEIMICAWFTAFFLGSGSTSIYTYTPELYPTEIRTTAMGMASAMGRAGGILLLLTFGVFSVLQGRLALFVVSDGLLLASIVAVALLGPSTKGRTLEETSAKAEQPAAAGATVAAE